MENKRLEQVEPLFGWVEGYTSTDSDQELVVDVVYGPDDVRQERFPCKQYGKYPIDAGVKIDTVKDEDGEGTHHELRAIV